MKVLCVVILSALVQSSAGVTHPLVKCLQEVAEKHFTPSRTLTIAYNNNSAKRCEARHLKYKNMCSEQESWSLVLEGIHQIAKWPVSLLNVNNERVTKEKTKDKHGSYILLSEEPENSVQDVRQQMTKIKSMSAWNPRAKYVVLIWQPSGMLTEDLAAEILSELWNSKAFNAITISRTSKNSLEFNIHTWFPYYPPGRCSDVKDATLLDIWTMNSDGNGSFIYNTNLYPRKIPRDMSGCPFMVSTFEYHPFIMKRKNTSVVEYEDGLDLRMIYFMGEALNASLILRPPPPDGGRWGFLLDNGTWVGVTAEMMRGYSDLALVGWFYRCHIINEIECSFPYLIDEARWYVPCAQPYPRWMSLTRVFKSSLWAGFLAAYVIVSLAMWQIVKISNKTTAEEIENQAYTSLTKCMLNFWAIILEESASNNPPHVGVIRAVFLIWVIYCWAVNTVYQTFLTSFLIDPGLQDQLSSEEEVLTSGITYGIPTTMVSILPGLQHARYHKRLRCDEVEVCQRRLAIERNLALFFTKYNNEFMVAKRYMDGDGNPMVCQFEGNYYRQYIVIPVPKGNQMLESYNNIIRHVHQAGLLEKWWKDLKYLATLSSAKDFNLPVGEYIKLTLEHLQSAFYFLFLGYLLSTISFFSEVVCRRRK